MKKAVFLLVTLIVNCTFIFGQNTVTDTSATIVGYWHKGDRQVLNISRSKESFNNGELSSSASSTYQAHVRILKETPYSYTIEWIYRGINTGTEESGLAKSLTKLTEGLKVIYKTDELGIFVELVNWKEMRDKINKSFDKITKEFGKNSEVKMAINQLKEVFSSKLAIEQTLIKDIQLYHSPFGGEYILNEKLEFEGELPNIFGGEPFTGIFYVELSELEPEKHYCKLEILQILDPVKSAELLAEILQKLVSVTGNTLDDNDVPKLDIKDNSEYEVDLYTGWLTRAYNKRVVIVDKNRQVETYEIRRQM